MIWNIVSKPWLKWQQTFRQIAIQCSPDRSLKLLLAQNFCSVSNFEGIQPTELEYFWAEMGLVPWVFKVFSLTSF